jgi:TM2 domain-containing membrane protein YozV
MATTLYGADLFSADSARDDITVRRRYDAKKKSLWMGTLLLALFGALGAHRFYVGHMGTGVGLLFLTAASVACMGTLPSTVGFTLVALWWIVDAVLLQRIIGEYNKRLLISLGH